MAFQAPRGDKLYRRFKNVKTGYARLFLSKRKRKPCPFYSGMLFTYKIYTFFNRISIQYLIQNGIKYIYLIFFSKIFSKITLRKGIFFNLNGKN